VNEALARIQSDPPTVVLALGPESFLREQTLRRAAELFLGAADSPDLVTVQPDPSVETPAETAARFLGEVRTSSLFGGRKLVALRDADAVVAAAKKRFAAWLAAPAAGVLGVLLAEELPAEVASADAERVVTVVCGGRGGPRESAAAFARRRASERGKRLAAADADLLVERVGDDLATLDNAIEVLSLHAGDAGAIASADLDALLRSAREGTVWEFGDRLAEGDLAAALTEAKRCFSEGVPEDFSGARVTFDERRIASKLVTAFTSSVTRGLTLARQIDSGVPRDALAYPDPPFARWLPRPARERAARLAARRRSPALEALLVRAEEAERGMKSGGADGRLAIARLATLAGMVR
jgi:DNA polymerase III delta subunit